MVQNEDSLEHTLVFESQCFSLVHLCETIQYSPNKATKQFLSLLMAASILQIAYDPALLQLRQMMLEKNGYNVVSGLGNQDGIARARSGRFDVIVIGFSTSLRLRQEAVRLLRQTCPDVPIVVLQAHSYEKFPDADFATPSENPENWLAAVANCLKKT